MKLSFLRHLGVKEPYFFNELNNPFPLFIMFGSDVLDCVRLQHFCGKFNERQYRILVKRSFSVVKLKVWVLPLITVMVSFTFLICKVDLILPSF